MKLLHPEKVYCFYRGLHGGTTGSTERSQSIEIHSGPFCVQFECSFHLWMCFLWVLQSSHLSGSVPSHWPLKMLVPTLLQYFNDYAALENIWVDDCQNCLYLTSCTVFMHSFFLHHLLVLALADHSLTDLSYVFFLLYLLQAVQHFIVSWTFWPMQLQFHTLLTGTTPQYQTGDLGYSVDSCQNFPEALFRLSHARVICIAMLKNTLFNHPSNFILPPNTSRCGEPIIK